MPLKISLAHSLVNQPSIHNQSAQGSFLNKKKCEIDVYYRVYSGDMMQFGASTRKYLVNGPDSQLPPEYESENTVKFRQQLMLKTLKAEEKKRKREEEVSGSFSVCC